MAVLSVTGLLSPSRVLATGGYPDHDASPCGNGVWCKDDTVNSPRGYAYRNCTDFVAWKLAVANDYTVPKNLGNAGMWGVNTNAKVDDEPAVGSVAWWDSGSQNHVAWVSSVSGDSVKVEEYNWGSNKGTHGERTIHKDEPTGYIHFKDIKTGSKSVVGTATFKGGNRLTSGQRLSSHEYILSGNGKHVLIMQADGNLVLYSNGKKARWSTGTHGNPGAYFVVQGDGNMVVYKKGGPAIWSSKTHGKDIARLEMQSDGNLVARSSSGKAQWASHTSGNPVHSYLGRDALTSGQRMHAGQYIRSSDKRYFLLMQGDGNLVLYSPGHHVLWSSGTHGNPGAYVEVQSGDGNIVVRASDGQPLWATATRDVTRLIVQNDGNLVARTASNAAVWASHTTGRL